MMSSLPQFPADESVRLDVLRATSLLDSPAEEAFDRFTRLASKMLQAPVAMISLIDKDRQFFKSQVGLSEPLATERQTPLSHSFCQHIVATAKPLVVSDARKHPLLYDNPAIKDHNVIAYLGVPLQTPENQTLGSLCTIDAKPRKWSEEEVSILEDLGVAVMTEIQLRMVAKEFLTNYLQVRNLEMQRDELTHMLVHDLRNPLLSLLLGLDVAQQTSNVPDAAKRCISISRQSGESLIRMITDILDVNKAEAGKLGLNLVNSSPAEVLNTACEQTEEMARAAEVTVTRTISAKLPTVRIDTEKLRRVLVNLISNAVQHTPRGGRVALSAVESPDRSALVFEVADTGLGIAKSAFRQLFDKFGSIDTHKMGRISSGLGLPFCKLAIEAHGGTISVESELGEGTVFHIDFPYAALNALT
jgi:signal transduction histidine kinase